jgi:hypothetical protein
MATLLQPPSTSSLKKKKKPQLNPECKDAFERHFFGRSDWDQMYARYLKQMVRILVTFFVEFERPLFIHSTGSHPITTNPQLLFQLISRQFLLINRRMMRGCTIRDTSLANTFQIIFKYRRGILSSIPIPDQTLYSLLQLVRPAEVSLSGLYHTDVERIGKIFEQSKGVLSEVLESIFVTMRYSSREEALGFVEQMKRMANYLSRFEINFSVTVSGYSNIHPLLSSYNRSPNTKSNKPSTVYETFLHD